MYFQYNRDQTFILDCFYFIWYVCLETKNCLKGGQYACLRVIYFTYYVSQYVYTIILVLLLYINVWSVIQIHRQLYPL